MVELEDPSSPPSHVILMPIVRFGKAWFLECINTSFWGPFSFVSTGQNWGLQKSTLARKGIPKEVKKDWWSSKYVWPFFSLGAMLARVVGWGNWSPSKQIVSIFTLFYFFPLECPSSLYLFRDFPEKIKALIFPIQSFKGFKLAHFPCTESFFSLERLKFNSVLQELYPSVPSTWIVISKRITLRLFATWWVGEANSSPNSWSFLVLVGALCLVWTPSVWEVGLVSLDDYFWSSSLVSSRFYGSGWWIGWQIYR